MNINETEELKDKNFTGYHWISDTTQNVVHYNLSFLELYLKTLPLIVNDEND